MRAHTKRPFGFTLLEVIVALVVAGFLGVVVVQLMGTQLLKSASPVTTTRDAAQAEAIMEQVVAFYTDYVNNNTTGALTAVYNKYYSAGNSTVSFTQNASNTFGADGLASMTVVVTVGEVSFATLLTQERTNSTDNTVTY
jgi:prepilin-type N-terminal cleavage/methylation domain-containing protein